MSEFEENLRTLLKQLSTINDLSRQAIDQINESLEKEDSIELTKKDLKKISNLTCSLEEEVTATKKSCPKFFSLSKNDESVDEQGEELQDIKEENKENENEVAETEPEKKSFLKLVDFSKLVDPRNLELMDKNYKQKSMNIDSSVIILSSSEDENSPKIPGNTNISKINDSRKSKLGSSRIGTASEIVPNITLRKLLVHKEKTPNRNQCHNPKLKSSAENCDEAKLRLKNKSVETIMKSDVKLRCKAHVKLLRVPCEKLKSFYSRQIVGLSSSKSTTRRKMVNLNESTGQFEENSESSSDEERVSKNSNLRNTRRNRNNLNKKANSLDRKHSSTEIAKDDDEDVSTKKKDKNKQSLTNNQEESDEEVNCSGQPNNENSSNEDSKHKDKKKENTKRSTKETRNRKDEKKLIEHSGSEDDEKSKSKTTNSNEIIVSVGNLNISNEKKDTYNEKEGTEDLDSRDSKKNKTRSKGASLEEASAHESILPLNEDKSRSLRGRKGKDEQKEGLESINENKSKNRKNKLEISSKVGNSKQTTTCIPEIENDGEKSDQHKDSVDCSNSEKTKAANNSPNETSPHIESLQSPIPEDEIKEDSANVDSSQKKNKLNKKKSKICEKTASKMCDKEQGLNQEAPSDKDECERDRKSLTGKDTVHSSGEETDIENDKKLSVKDDSSEDMFADHENLDVSKHSPNQSKKKSREKGDKKLSSDSEDEPTKNRDSESTNHRKKRSLKKADKKLSSGSEDETKMKSNSSNHESTNQKKKKSLNKASKKKSSNSEDETTKNSDFEDSDSTNQRKKKSLKNTNKNKSSASEDETTQRSYSEDSMSTNQRKKKYRKKSNKKNSSDIEDETTKKSDSEDSDPTNQRKKKSLKKANRKNSSDSEDETTKKNHSEDSDSTNQRKKKSLKKADKKNSSDSEDEPTKKSDSEDSESTNQRKKKCLKKTDKKKSSDSEDETKKSDSEDSGSNNQRKSKSRKKANKKNSSGSEDEITKKSDCEDSESTNEIEKKSAKKANKKLSPDSEDETKKNSDSSDSDLKKRKRNKKSSSEEEAIVLESDSDDSDDVCGKIAKKTFRNIKKRMKTLASDSGSDSEDNAKEESDEGSKSDKDGSDNSSKNEKRDTTKKRGRIRNRSLDSSDSDTNKTRKKLKKVLSKQSLSDLTKKAAAEEKERKQRIQEKQKKYNQIYENLELVNSKVDKLILDVDEETEEPLLEVSKDLVSKLKPHQASGIQFMWDACFESLKRAKSSAGSGCILAHCMGLGKTLQVIALTDTLLEAWEKTNIKKILIVSPLSTILNWKAEYRNWLSGEEDYDIYELVSCKPQMSERSYIIKTWHLNGGVMLMSYAMFRNLSSENKRVNKKIRTIFAEALVDPGPDMVICDEGHLLKNEKTGLSVAMNKIKTRRRIVLTGTPLQNNLKEYYCMVQFVKPNLLGTYKEYMNRFVNPITNGQYTDSTAYDINIMRRRSHVLHKLLEGIVQRRDYSVLSPYLPPKFEYVLFLTLSDIQKKLYEYYLNNLSKRNEGTNKGSYLFQDFQALSRICIHPRVLLDKTSNDLQKDESEAESLGSLKDFVVNSDSTSSSSSTSDSGSDDENSKKKTKATTRLTRAQRAARRESEEEEEEDMAKQAHKEWYHEFCDDNEFENIANSTKLLLLFEILKECEVIGDKVLLFSQSLYALNCIEYFLGKVDEATQRGDAEETTSGYTGSWVPGLDYFRLDGSTNCNVRSNFCDSFNKESNSRARLFLLSTKAGGLGINLVSANRVIIFDVSWNPSSDVQSIYRIYRFGQLKPSYIYRFVINGAMEMKIYERQVTKQAISKRVIDEQQIDRHYNQNDLAELYKFEQPGVEDRPIPMVPKDVLLGELLQNHEDKIFKYHDHQSLLENKVDETLNEEEMKTAWEEFENEKVQRTRQDLIGKFSLSTVQLALRSIIHRDNPAWNNNQILSIIPQLIQQLQQQLSLGDYSMYNRITAEIKRMQEEYAKKMQMQFLQYRMQMAGQNMGPYGGNALLNPFYAQQQFMGNRLPGPSTSNPNDVVELN